MIREVADNVVDVSVAGFAVTEKRATIVDYSFLTVQDRLAVMIRRPQDTDVSTKYYTGEFTTYSWIFLGCSGVFIWFMTTIIVDQSSDTKVSFFKLVITTFAITSRAYIGKVTIIKSQTS